MRSGYLPVTTRLSSPGHQGLPRTAHWADDMTGQATQAWQNIETILNQAGVSLPDIVSVRQRLPAPRTPGPTSMSEANSSPTSRPFMLGVIPGLVRPGFLIEIEVVAAVPAGKGEPEPAGLAIVRPVSSVQV